MRPLRIQFLTWLDDENDCIVETIYRPAIPDDRITPGVGEELEILSIQVGGAHVIVTPELEDSLRDRLLESSELAEALEEQTLRGYGAE